MSRNAGVLLYPPLPVTTIFPFQAVGIHTSKFTCESFEVTTRAWTRQNAGASVREARAPGGVKPPAGCRSTAVTVTPFRPMRASAAGSQADAAVRV